MRLLRLAAVALLAFPSLVAAQEVVDPPSVVLSGVPFRMTVTGGTEPSAWYEIRTADGAVLSAGAVEAFSAATETDLVVTSRDQLPLTVLIGATTHEVRPTLIPGWLSIASVCIAVLPNSSRTP